MKKEEYNELVVLSMYGELTKEEKKKIEAYLKKHRSLMNEYKKLKKFKTFVTKYSPQITTDEILHDARKQLRSSLQNERSTSLPIKIFEDIIGVFSRPRAVFGSIAAMSLGFFIGYCSFSPSVMENGLVIHPVSNETMSSNEARVQNVRFLDADASDGEVEFEFEAVAPMRLKGTVDNPEIQKVLANALLNASNAGVRLATMSAFAQQIEEKKLSDPTVKAALIASMNNDDNPGVRREALRVLQQFEFDAEIRNALLQVLTTDKNSGLRVAAINALESAKMDGNTFDRKVAEILNEQIKKESNNYIRNRAATLVKEIIQ